ncbi:MAG: hypothetical protein HZA16_07720 [Nitrospirae bacterium]|nr:hypothetical protein [Nitrospirota bacterium]
MQDILKMAGRRLRRLLWGKNNKRPPVAERKQRWSIGIYCGDSPLSITPAEGAANPVLTHEDISDIKAYYIADPFMFLKDNAWYMFFEVKRRDNNKGEIGLAVSADGLRWGYQRIVLAEPFHLSYPYVFEWQGEYYMLPEAWKSGGVSLYRAESFPEKWSCMGKLISGRRIVDSSIFRYADMWWILTDTGKNYMSPVLSLYYSKELPGPWVEHPLSPVVKSDPHIARPGGRVIIMNGRPVRFTQDVVPVYGKQVYAFEIAELSPTKYREVRLNERPIVAPGSYGWNNGGMHHIDACRLRDGKWMACVDGFDWYDPEEQA